jgi:hypothetical protein
MIEVSLVAVIGLAACADVSNAHAQSFMPPAGVS